MEIKLFDKVKIIENGIFGTVVDIYQDNGSSVFVVESDSEKAKGGYGDKWPLFDCLENEIEKLKKDYGITWTEI
ncbi:Uncharacterised protein [uncultured Ruminococcus sp.]|jgi:hypothetical protein|nr:hypothetical protein [Clostridiales bacterium]SCH61641.1 Uncharacterised protein [uncultured Clostridium sp.]SCH76038.1 Uncharacterised protein [uncultured Ruminococcus sp.]DAP83216.1 MAG TPA: protein of unknown function (DUF1815) [Caudoviricetes sp.]